MEVLHRMSDLTTDLMPGELVRDTAQNNTTMVVTNTDVGRVRELDDATREIILDNYGNHVTGVTEDTPCVEAVYASLNSEPSKTYTFPVSRLVRPEIERARDVHGTAAEMAQAHLLREMLAALELTGQTEAAEAVADMARKGTTMSDEAVEYAREQADLDVRARVGDDA